MPGAWRHWVAAMLAVSGAALTGQQPPVFRGGVDLVSVDAFVVDDQGRPISGLGPADFQLTVDGQPRELVSAEFFSSTGATGTNGLESGTGTPTAASAGKGLPRLPEISSNDIQSSGRVVLLAIDRSNIHFGEGSEAMAAVRRLVERLSPNDRIGVFTHPSAGQDVPLTADREAIAAALGTIRGVEMRQGEPSIALTAAEALNIERTRPNVAAKTLDRNCSAAGTIGQDDPSYFEQCKTRLLAEAGRLAREIRQRNEDTLAWLERLIEIVRYVEGPKTVVFISQGLPLDYAQRARLSHVGSTIAAADTSFYAVQPYTTPTDIFAQGLLPDWEEDRRLRADGLSALAGVSGGALFRPGAGLDSSFERIARELSARYVLGFQVAQRERDGKIHRIGVTLKNPRARVVRHRTEFTAGTRPRGYVRRVETLAGALSEPLPISTLPLRLATYVVPDAGSAFKVLLNAEIGRGTIGLDASPVKVAYEIVNAARQRVGQGEDSIALAGRTSAAAGTSGAAAGGAHATPLRYTTSMPLAPGRYRVKFAARDASGRLGSVDHHFAVDAGVPGMSSPRANEAGASGTVTKAAAGISDLAVSSLMLFRSSEGDSTRPELIFNLSSREPGFGAHVIARTAVSGNDLSAVLEVTNAEGVTRVSRGMTPAPGVTPEQRTFELHVPTKGWPLGQYIAKVTLLKANDPVARVQRELELRAAPPALSAPRSSDGGAGDAASDGATAGASGGAAAGASGNASGPARRDLSVDQVVARAIAYVRDYAARAATVVAEEHYVQAIVEEIAGNSPTPIEQVLQWRTSGARDLSPGVLARRQLRSDLLMVKTSTGWYTNYRDVAEVDGEPIKNREQRALALFTSGGSGDDVGATLRKITEEGTRYNLGMLRRTVNVPTLALFTLHPDHVARFTFEAAGTESIDGAPVLMLSFRERQRPTFIMTADGHEVFTTGRLWVAPDSGRVVRTELVFEQEAPQRRVRLDVHYARVEVVDLLMPSRMRERYVPLSPSRDGRTQVITGEARYTNFRVFSVQTNEHKE
jgi:VWFA-related protein